jgi:NADH-quinone oxidoreductase subunit M
VGVQGAIYLMVGHGLVSSGLFFLVGFLYDRYHVREVRYFGGLVYSMPLYSTFFAIFILANLSLPGTCNFIGEILILVGLLQKQPQVTVIISFCTVLSAVYSMFLFNRVIFSS